MRFICTNQLGLDLGAHIPVSFTSLLHLQSLLCWWTSSECLGFWSPSVSFKEKNDSHNVS